MKLTEIKRKNGRFEPKDVTLSRPYLVWTGVDNWFVSDATLQAGDIYFYDHANLQEYTLGEINELARIESS